MLSAEPVGHGNRKGHAPMNEASIRPPKAVQLAPQSMNSAQGDLEAIRREKLLEVPVRQRGIFLRAWAGRSRKAAVRSFCLACCGFESAEVARCTAPACPLYEYRKDRL